MAEPKTRRVGNLVLFFGKSFSGTENSIRIEPAEPYPNINGLQHAFARKF